MNKKDSTTECLGGVFLSGMLPVSLIFIIVQAVIIKPTMSRSSLKRSANVTANALPMTDENFV